MFRRLLALLLLAGPVAAAAPLKFSSGPARVRLVELFTSEGCSSCPPAEAWLNGLRRAPGLWRDFVPVAWHVNYWDRLGWPDRLASGHHTARQQAYARTWGADTVYTPGFVLDGREWRDRSGRPPAAAPGPAGMLTVETAAESCVVTYQPAGAPGAAYEVHVALLGGGFVSAVKAGENRGEVLKHEFVALAQATHRLQDGTARLPLPAARIAGVTDRALAVWVTRRGSLEPLQAAGGWLD